MSFRILLVDDEHLFADALGRELAEHGYVVEVVYDGETALARLTRDEPDLVLLDVRMPRVDGIEVLRRIRATSPALPIVMVTAYDDPETVVRAMKAGADDFVTKSFQTEQLLHVLGRIRQTVDLQREVATLRVRLRDEERRIVLGRSRSLRMAFDTLEKIARVPNFTVLLTGESGSGKEVAARYLHSRSGRAREPFVDINCAAIPENLLEAEMFGHEAGAFTGARGRREGLLELADGGTVFLDEVATLSVPLQSKLLRFLEERSFRRLGGRTTIRVDVAVVAATNRDLAAMVESGEFREDLFYRLNVISVVLPPLRERREDIVPLAEAFVENVARSLGRPAPRLGTAAREALLRYDFPGNVRELRNVIERAMILGEEGREIQPDQLALVPAIGVSPMPREGDPADGGEVRDPTRPGREASGFESSAEGTFGAGDVEAVLRQLPTMPLRDLADFYIREVLRRTGGRKAEAADLLGISRTTLFRRL